MKTKSNFLWRILGVAVAFASYHIFGSEAGIAALTPLFMGSVTTDFYSKCVPVLRTNIATCGLMTVCDAIVPAPSEFDTIFKDGTGFRVMKALFMHQLELNACQVEQSNLHKFLMANKVDMSKKLPGITEMISTDLVKIRPYILARRQAPRNNNFWNVSGGAASLANGTLDAEGTYWKVTVSSPTGVPAHAGWFNPSERVFISGQTEGGTATNTAWQVYSSAVAGNTVVLVLASENANSFLEEDQIEYPVTGLLERGTANKDDFESFCQRGPGLITSQMDEFWVETTRDITCEDDLYVKWRDLVFDNNPLYATMYDLTTIEYNKQSGEDFYNRLANTAFWNKPLVNQSIETVEDLATIEGRDLTGARCIGKKANAIGWFEQHVQCGRYIDLQGQPININALAKALYRMWRVRKTSGSKAGKVFEAYIPSQFFPAWNRAMLEYYDVQAGRDIQYTRSIDQSSNITKGVAPMGFVYHDYPLVWPDVIIRVLTDEFFDDRLTASIAAGNTTAGYQMWILDWSKNYIGVLETNRVKNQTADRGTLAAVNDEFMCRMRSLGRTVVMTSITHTYISECPAGDLILGNFSAAQPNAEDDAGEYGQTTTTTTTTTSTTTAP